MNQEQLNFVMDKLKVMSIIKRYAIASVIIEGRSAYILEIECSIPKNTLNRSVKKCNDKWKELLADSNTVYELTCF